MRQVIISYNAPLYYFSTYVHNILCNNVDKIKNIIILLNNVHKEFSKIQLYTAYTQTNKQGKCLINIINRC